MKCIQNYSTHIHKAHFSCDPPALWTFLFLTIYVATRISFFLLNRANQLFGYAMCGGKFNMNMYYSHRNSNCKMNMALFSILDIYIDKWLFYMELHGPMRPCLTWTYCFTDKHTNSSDEDKQFYDNLIFILGILKPGNMVFILKLTLGYSYSQRWPCKLL